MLKRDPVLHPKKNSRETTGEKIFNVVNVLFMLALCVVVLLPMLGCTGFLLAQGLKLQGL